MRRPVEYSATAGGTGSRSRKRRREKRQPLAGRPGFIDINQYPRQGFTHAYWQYRRRICAASDTGAYRAGHQAFRHIRYRLKTGGAGAAYAIGIGMNIHSRTQHNFARNIGASGICTT